MKHARSRKIKKNMHCRKRNESLIKRRGLLASESKKTVNFV